MARTRVTTKKDRTTRTETRVGTTRAAQKKAQRTGGTAEVQDSSTGKWRPIKG